MRADFLQNVILLASHNLLTGQTFQVTWSRLDPICTGHCSGLKQQRGLAEVNTSKAFSQYHAGSVAKLRHVFVSSVFLFVHSLDMFVLRFSLLLIATLVTSATKALLGR